MSDTPTRTKMVEAGLWPEGDPRDPAENIEAALELATKWHLFLTMSLSPMAQLPEFKHKEWANGNRNLVMQWNWGQDTTLPRAICRCLLSSLSQGYIEPELNMYTNWSAQFAPMGECRCV